MKKNQSSKTNYNNTNKVNNCNNCKHSSNNNVRKDNSSRSFEIDPNDDHSFNLR